MRWHDQAFILNSRLQGEKNRIVEVFTENHGRHFGIVRGGRLLSRQALLQPGNFVDAKWNARLEEHLGYFSLELITPHAADMMRDPLLLYGFQLVSSHIHLLPEREPYKKIYQFLNHLLKNKDNLFLFAQLLVHFELLYLKEIGFGLNLSHCAVTKTKDDLCYASPKSGCAVTRQIGEALKDRLLSIPCFLQPLKKEAKTKEEIYEGFQLTGYFLERHLWKFRKQREFSARENFTKKFFETYNKISKNI